MTQDEDKSTPRPWKIDYENWWVTHADGGIICHLDKRDLQFWPLIVSAVNSHAAMKEALEKAAIADRTLTAPTSTEDATIK